MHEAARRPKNERRIEPEGSAFLSSFLSILSEMRTETGGVALITDSGRTSAGRDVARIHGGRN